jgi:hypothetical protein
MLYDIDNKNVDQALANMKPLIGYKEADQALTTKCEAQRIKRNKDADAAFVNTVKTGNKRVCTQSEQSLDQEHPRDRPIDEDALEVLHCRSSYAEDTHPTGHPDGPGAPSVHAQTYARQPSDYGMQPAFFCVPR